MTITDPCHDSIVNSDPLNQFGIEKIFRVPQGSDERILSTDGPSDSVSLAYGNGYDICGPLSYQFTNAGDGLPFAFSSHENFSYSVEQMINAADKFNMKLTSVPFGLEIEETVKLEIKLIGYPSSSPAIFNLQIIYRECLPENF